MDDYSKTRKEKQEELRKQMQELKDKCYPSLGNYETDIKPVEGFAPAPYKKAKVRFEGSEYATMKYQERPTKTHVKRIDATHYEVLATGEIKEYMTMDEEKKAFARRASLTRTFDELRCLIRANFTAETENQCFVTLTYRENMKDPKRLYDDFNLFMINLSNAYAPNEKTYKEGHKFTYIAVAEPQGRGAWHIHLMIKSNRGYLWFEKHWLTKKWGHGSTTVSRLKSDDVGAYYTAYFTGLIADTTTTEDDATELDESEFETGESVLELEQAFAESNRLKKKYIKGERLPMYPPHFKFYRCSRNVIRPATEEMHVFEFDAAYGGEFGKEGYEKIYDRTHEIRKIDLDNGEIEHLNTIHKATFRKKRGIAAASPPLLTAENIVLAAKEDVKPKRGRPRKYEQTSL